MTPNELRDLKEIAAGRAPVGSGPQAVAKAILILLNLANDVRALADEVRDLRTEVKLNTHVHPLVLPDGSLTEPKKEEAP